MFLQILLFQEKKITLIEMTDTYFKREETKIDFKRYTKTKSFSSKNRNVFSSSLVVECKILKILFI